MNKTNFIIIGFVVLVVIIFFSIYSPKDINTIIENDVMDLSYTRVHILETCSWLQPKEAESNNLEKINQLLEHLGVPPTSPSKLTLRQYMETKTLFYSR